MSRPVPKINPAVFLGALAVAFVAATAAPAQTASPNPKEKVKAAAKEKAKTATKAAAKLDLNRATAEELEDTLPGVGPATARKIIEGRPYASVDDLGKAGVPARTIDQIRPLVTVGPAHETKAEARPKAEPKEAVAKKEADAPAARVDLNHATAEQLESLPGVGPTHARDIIAARPLRSVDDLERVKGLGKARIDALRDRVTVSPPAAPNVPTPGPATTKTAAPKPATPATRPAPAATRPAGARPVNLNTASLAELDALPGIGPVKAAAIVEHRQTQPFKAKEDVMKVKGIKEGEFAKIKDLITVE